MDKQQESMEHLREIRSMMERSSRFLSLSGLSGILSGITALAGVAAAYYYLGMHPADDSFYERSRMPNGSPDWDFYAFMVCDMFLVLFVSLLAATILTIRNARIKDRPVWDGTARRLLINMLIPLLAGGFYCLMLLHLGFLELIAPATLVFYGMTLFNASKYTLNDIRYLGVLEIITGLSAMLVPSYGMLFWAFGFGILHIVYGILMYAKYEK